MEILEVEREEAMSLPARPSGRLQEGDNKGSISGSSQGIRMVEPIKK